MSFAAFFQLLLTHFVKIFKNFTCILFSFNPCALTFLTNSTVWDTPFNCLLCLLAITLRYFFYLRYNVIIYSHSYYNFSYSLSMRFKNLVFSFLFCYCCSQCFGGVMYMFFARLEPLSIVLFCYCFSVLLWFLFVLIYCCFIGCIYTWKNIITQIQYLNASY